MKCIYEYVPNHPDELELKIGDIIDVTKVQLDGEEDWGEGFNTRTKEIGAFPTNYCETVVARIPKPKQGGRIMEALFDFAPKEQATEDASDYEDYIEMKAHDFLELLPQAIQVGFVEAFINLNITFLNL